MIQQNRILLTECKFCCMILQTFVVIYYRKYGGVKEILPIFLAIKKVQINDSFIKT